MRRTRSSSTSRCSLGLLHSSRLFPCCSRTQRAHFQRLSRCLCRPISARLFSPWQSTVSLCSIPSHATLVPFSFALQCWLQGCIPLRAIGASSTSPCMIATATSYGLVRTHLHISINLPHLTVTIGPNELSIRNASAVPALLGVGGMPKGPSAYSVDFPVIDVRMGAKNLFGAV